MEIAPERIEDAAKELYLRALKELPPDIKEDLRGLNLTAEDFLGSVGLKAPAGEKDHMLIEQIATRPTAEINGVIGGYTGEGAKTVIPGQAMAKVSFRLVGDQDPEAIRRSFRAFVGARLPSDCKATFLSHGGDRGVSLPSDSPWVKKAERALTEEWGRPAKLIAMGKT